MGLLDLQQGQTIALKITLHTNGALSVEGPIHDKAFCLAMLENAKDAVRNHGMPKGIHVPSRDVSIPEIIPKVVV